MLDILTDAVERTRQHHAIEHATIHILSARHPGRSFTGYSDPLGFTVFGELDEYDLQTAVGDALLSRLADLDCDLLVMGAYGHNIPLRDRWAIVAYVQALIRAQYASIEDVPAEGSPNGIETHASSRVTLLAGR